VQHVALLGIAEKIVDTLLVHLRAERHDGERLCLSAREERRAVGARQQADFARDLAHLIETAPVGPAVFAEHAIAKVGLLDIVEDVRDRAFLFGETLGEGFQDLLADGVDCVLATPSCR